VNEAGTRRELADLDVASVQHFEEAIRLSQQARPCFPPGSPATGHSLLVESNARLRLAGLGIEPQQNLEEAIALCHQARRCFPSGSPDAGSILMSEGLARKELAGLGSEPKQNFDKAIALCHQARSCFPPCSPDAGLTLLNECDVLLGLFELGIAPVQILQEAISVCQQARPCFPPGSPHTGRTLINEGNALQKLAKLGIAPVLNLEEAIRLSQQARPCFPPGSPHTSTGNTLLLEGLARQELANLGIEPVLNVEKAITLCQQARPYFTPGSRHTGHALLNEGILQLSLAESRQDAEATEEMRQAEALLTASLTCFESQSPDQARCQVVLSYALRCLGRTSESYENLQFALGTFEEVRAQLHQENERISYLETVAELFAQMVELCLALADEATTVSETEKWQWEAWYWVHRGKSRSLLERLAQTALQRSGLNAAHDWDELDTLGQTLDTRERKLGVKQHQLESNGTPRAKMTTAPELQPLIEVRQLAFEAYVGKRDELFENNNGHALPLVEPPPPQEVLKHLRLLAGLEDNATRRPLLVEYFTVSASEVRVFLSRLWEPGLPEIKRFDVPYGKVHQMALTLLECTTSQSTRSPGRAAHARSEQDQQDMADRFKQLLDELGQYLVEPWASSLEKWQPTEVILAPHYLVNLLPLHAATVGDKALIEHVPVVYLPAPHLASELVKRQKTGAMGEALVVGNPLTGDPLIDEWMKLPGAKDEAQDVADRLRERGMHVHLLLGPEATTARVLEHVRTASVVHVACHSLMDWDFLRSGWELSDRRLTVLEVMSRLEVRGATLVYAGSCDSAQAVPGRTDELLAMVRGFFHGSPTVVASLWGLNDAVGNVFADVFYKLWLQEDNRMSLAEVFQKAMLATRASYPHNPAHWAPFVLIGAWQ
jgi:CHAT domain-containing protein/tetratricopeptide (TPR) repeat protein